jgi:hypothetical protein
MPGGDEAAEKASELVGRLDDFCMALLLIASASESYLLEGERLRQFTLLLVGLFFRITPQVRLQ